MLESVGDRPDAAGDPILMRDDNMATVTCITRCSGATDKVAWLFMRMLGRAELVGKWNATAKNIPGAKNTLVDGISSSPGLVLEDEVRKQAICTYCSNRTSGHEVRGLST